MLLSVDTCLNTVKAWKIIGIAVMILKILVPVLIIITSTIPIFNALIKGTLDELTGSMKKIFMKIMAGIIVFLIPTFISSTMKLLIGTDGKSEDVMICVDCFEDPNGNDCQQHIEDYNGLDNTEKVEEEEKVNDNNSIEGGSVNTDSYANGASSEN